MLTLRENREDPDSEKSRSAGDAEEKNKKMERSSPFWRGVEDRRVAAVSTEYLSENLLVGATLVVFRT